MWYKWPAATKQKFSQHFEAARSSLFKFTLLDFQHQFFYCQLVCVNFTSNFSRQIENFFFFFVENFNIKNKLNTFGLLVASNKSFSLLVLRDKN